MSHLRNASNSSLTNCGRSEPAAFGLRDEGRRVLLHQAVQRGLFRAVAIVVNPGDIRLPLRLPAAGFAREAPEVVSRHGLKPCAALQSPRVPPTCVHQLLRDHL